MSFRRDAVLCEGRRFGGGAAPLEMTLFYAGLQVCPPGHAHYGVRDHYLLHYVFAGCGLFTAEGQTHALGPGDGFLMFPNRPASYRADVRSPWTYGWIGFSGARAELHLARAGLTRHAPAFRSGRAPELEACCRELVAWTGAAGEAEVAAGQDLRFTSLLYRLLHLLAGLRPESGAARGDGYVPEAIRFLQRNHSRPVTIAELARHLGLDRKYLAALFRKQTGMSPKAYLTRTRLAAATGLLRGTSLPVYAVAHSVGYADEFHFSRVFRAGVGCSPSRYRRGAKG